jgi:hypothetical protein
LIDIDFKKYKRFFAFGCSFTGYIWPTWADILSKQMPDAEFYNLGFSGGGNLFISNRIVETNQRFKFCDTDLVVIMWSTFCREDRYINYWRCPGNIFTQSTYDNDFVEKFADTKGYLIKDLGLIGLTHGYLTSSTCDFYMLNSVDYTYQNENLSDIATIFNVYNSVITRQYPSLLELEMQGVWEHGHHYFDDSQPKYDEIFHDYHPNPLRYFNYLEKLGLKLSDEVRLFAEESTNKLHRTTLRSEINKIFPNYQHGSYRKFL